MKAGETDELLIGLLGDVYARIEGLYQILEEALKELKLLTASADEKNSARLDKFGNSGGGDEDFDYEKWQEEKEEEFAASWYDFKRAWNEETRARSRRLKIKNNRPAKYAGRFFVAG